MAEWSKRFDGQLKVFPPVTDCQLTEVPPRRGILGLLNQDDVPIVLFSAANIRGKLARRLSEPVDNRRRKTADLRAITRKVLWKLTSSHFETDLEFLELACRIWPETYEKLLGWKAPWFVHVDPADAYPHFVRTCKLPSTAGRTEGQGASSRVVGPFSNARSAERFIEAIQDTFDLCRDWACLRESPRAQRCSYAQMNRCLSPCDGTITMDEYRKAITAAAEFAAGAREPLGVKLAEQMKVASDKLKFERAGAIKARLKRLAEFDNPSYAHIGPIEEFRYIIIQPSGSSRKAKVFVGNCGAIFSSGASGELDYPLKGDQVAHALEQLASQPPGHPATNDADLLRIGLIVKYLFYSKRRSGLILRWTEAMTSADLCESIESARELLKLRPPSKPRKTTDVQKASKPGTEFSDKT